MFLNHNVFASDSQRWIDVKALKCGVSCSTNQYNEKES